MIINQIAVGSGGGSAFAPVASTYNDTYTEADALSTDNDNNVTVSFSTVTSEGVIT